MKKYILTIDNGSQSTKVSIFDLSGNMIAHGTQKLQPLILGEDGYAVHPDDDI